MLVMGKSRWLRCGLVAAIFAFVLTTGCSRPAGSNQTKDRNLPFHQEAQSNPDAAISDQSQTQNPGTNRGNDEPQPSPAPFDRVGPWDLPAGTLLTVRLRDPLASSNLDAGRGFVAVVDEPIIVEGKAVVAMGSVVHGRVESARASDGKRDAGYMRLTLDSVTISRRQVSLQTASLFARGSAREGPSLSDGSSGAASRLKTIRLGKGRRLTFRLTSNLALPTAAEQAGTESSRPLSY
jgi:hypothetical protein